MSTQRVKIEMIVTTHGSILDWLVEIENLNVGHWDVGGNKSTKILDDFEIDDILDVLFICKGRNGATATLDLTITTKSNKVINKTINAGIYDGYFRTIEKILIV